MKVLITGSAGFIGSTLAIKLLERGDQVVGIDNINDYYDVNLKQARLARVKAYEGFTEIKAGIEDREAMERVFSQHKPQRVVNLAAQAGVRYSLSNPHAYIESNIVGFMNVLECCRHNQVEHLVYASSSSVYGANTTMPFSVHNNVDHPLSLYAASKKSNELMAHTYSHLYQLPTTGLRFSRYTDRGEDPIWLYLCLPKTSCRASPLTYLTTATTVAISRLSMILSKVLRVRWIALQYPISVGRAIIPILLPALHLTGSII